MPSREEVFEAINTERDYQDMLPASRTDGNPRSVGDYITMLQHYQKLLVEAWTMNPGDAQALEIMRKVAGIAVHCMEDHGAPLRPLAGLRAYIAAPEPESECDCMAYNETGDCLHVRMM